MAWCIWVGLHHVARQVTRPRIRLRCSRPQVGCNKHWSPVNTVWCSFNTTPYKQLLMVLPTDSCLQLYSKCNSVWIYCGCTWVPFLVSCMKTLLLQRAEQRSFHGHFKVPQHVQWAFLSLLLLKSCLHSSRLLTSLWFCYIKCFQVYTEDVLFYTLSLIWIFLQRV